MKDSLDTGEVQIPEYEYLSIRLDCEHCTYECDCEHRRIAQSSAGYSRNLYSRCDCEKILKRISSVKWLLEILIFCSVTVFSLISFSGFWLTALKLLFTYIFLLISDILSDKILKYIFTNSERKRREKYYMSVKKLKEENEAIKRAKAGITKEVQEFLDKSKVLYQNLSSIFETIRNNLNFEEKNEQRVVLKFQEVLNELEILNSKLSKNNFESSYITTLYEIHLPKLLEYSLLFFENCHSGNLTSKQIVEFSNLLEVFKVKISKHTEYLQQKTEDDFLIKMKALNEDVIPDFDGSEGQNNE